MPMGVGAELVRNLPEVEFDTDPELFMQLTRKQVKQTRAKADPGAGGTINIDLPQAGIVSKAQVVWVGTLTIATAAVTTGDEWPYNLLKKFGLSISGVSDLWGCDGCDLQALRFVRYPSYDDDVDNFPGTVGGGNSVAVGTYDIYLTWEVPIAVDDTTLVGSLYAQSSQSGLSLALTRSTNAELFSANPANATLAGNFYVLETVFDIPRNPASGNIVVPDLSRLHAFEAHDTPITANGEVESELIRSEGQLSRLLVSARSSATNRLSAMPSAASTKKIDRLRIEYGLGEKPLDFNPAAALLSLNNQHYGTLVPYDRMVIDQLRENPVRDAILLQGVTELRATLTVNSGVTVTAGKIRTVQETLY
jgi:hypothetical protein